PAQTPGHGREAQEAEEVAERLAALALGAHARRLRLPARPVRQPEGAQPVVPAEQTGNLPEAAVGEADHRLRPAGPECALEEPARVEARGVHQVLHGCARHVADLPAAREEPETEVALLADARVVGAAAQARVEAARGEEGFATYGQVQTARRIVPRPPAEVRRLGTEVVGCEVGCEGCVPPAGQRAGEAEPHPPAGAGDARIRERGEERGEPAVGGDRVVVDESGHLSARGAGPGV